MQNQDNPYSAEAPPAATPAAPAAHQPGPAGKPVRRWSYPPSTFSTLYVWWLVLFLAGTVLTITVIGAILGLPMLIAGTVLFFIFLYKSWNQIQDGSQRTTPGKAVGFLFIPFFNFYWLFVGIHGLSVNLNAYARRNNVQTPPVAEQLSLAYCILVLCTILPTLGFVFWIGAVVTGIILMGQLKNASVAIALHNRGEAA